MVSQCFILRWVSQRVFHSASVLFLTAFAPVFSYVIVVQVRIEACVDFALRFAEDPIHLGQDALLEDLVKLFRGSDLWAFYLLRGAWMHSGRLALSSRSFSALLHGVFLCFNSGLDLKLDLEATSHAPLPEEVSLIIYIFLLDLEVVLILIDITISRVVVLVLEILETLFLVEGCQKFSVPDFHLDEVHWEWRQVHQWLDMLTSPQVLDLVLTALLLLASCPL